MDVQHILPTRSLSNCKSRSRSCDLSTDEKTAIANESWGPNHHPNSKHTQEADSKCQRLYVPAAARTPIETDSSNVQPTSSPTDMHTAELEDARATLVAPVRAARGPVKAAAKSPATRASVQAANVFMVFADAKSNQRIKCNAMSSLLSLAKGVVGVENLGEGVASLRGSGGIRVTCFFAVFLFATPLLVGCMHSSSSTAHASY